MRTVHLLIPLVAACSLGTSSTGDDTADDDDPSVDTADSVGPQDTSIVWDSGEGVFVGDTFELGDDPIDPTSLDGTWTGSFELIEVTPLGTNPKCAGEITLTIDPTAFRHVTARASCDTWDPQSPVGPRYGTLTGIGYGTLDPSNLSVFRMDMGWGARNKQLWDALDFRVRDVEGALVVDVDDVFGIGALRAGHRLTWEVNREDP